MAKRLRSTVHIHGDPENGVPGGVFGPDDDVPADVAKLITNEEAWESDEKPDDSDGLAALRSSDVPRALLVQQAEALGAKFPKNASKDLLAQAIRQAEGRNTSADEPDAFPEAADAPLAGEVTNVGAKAPAKSGS
jgi:hypothetical protein